MGYREVDMWEILEVLRRLHRGEPIAAIHLATGRSRKTIRRYEREARELGWVPGLADPTEELAGVIQQRRRPTRRKPEPGAVEKELLPHGKQIRQWIQGDGVGRGLRLTKVHQLLIRRGVDVPYSSLHRFAVKHCGFADNRRVTVRMAPCKPGELAEVDFGCLGLVWDPGLERRRKLHALIVTLGYSRHMYVHLTHSQKLPDLIDGLEDAWVFFDGVTARVVVDNLKAAVTKPDRYDPIFQRSFEEYASYRGFVIDPCVVRHATGKPTVERAVPYVRESFFRGESWRDRAHVQEEVFRWCMTTAGTRIHGTTCKRPLAVFENAEKTALLPLKRGRFDPPDWAQCKVHGDHHVNFSKALYSVPTRYLGEKVWVRADRKLVRIYSGGELVKTHKRQPQGGRSTDYEDYPKEKTPYALRDPNRLIRAAKERGEHLGSFMERLLAGVFPWANLRQGQKLLRLCEKYGAKTLDQACERALAFNVINVKRVDKIVCDHLEAAPKRRSSKATVVQLPLRFAREAKSFTHPNEGGES
jgi:transposase